MVPVPKLFRCDVEEHCCLWRRLVSKPSMAEKMRSRQGTGVTAEAALWRTQREVSPWPIILFAFPNLIKLCQRNQRGVGLERRHISGVTRFTLLLASFACSNYLGTFNEV